MNTATLVVVAVIVVAAIVAIWFVLRRRRSEHLRTRFGPEYQRTVAEAKSPGAAESELEARERKVAKLRIRSLTDEESGRYAEAWRKVQARFVDEPRAALRDADLLVTEVMSVRGYPMADFDERAADLSVDHADVVEHYRAAHAIAYNDPSGGTDTEEMRQAMRHYRALFDDLVEVEEPHPARRR